MIFDENHPYLLHFCRIWVKERGLSGPRLIISDKCLGLVEALGEFYPDAAWQRCAVHFYRNVWTAVPSGKVKEVAAMPCRNNSCPKTGVYGENSAILHEILGN